MRFFLLILILLPFKLIHAQKAISCVFPNSSEQMLIDDCVQKIKNGYSIKKAALAKFNFDTKDLAGGSIANDGCYWVNKKGLVRKTHCYDNHADTFQDGLTRHVDAKGKFGYMNEKLEIKIPAQYTFSFPFERGHAKVCMDCKQEKIQDSENLITTGGDWKIIDKTGKVVKTCPGATKEYECLAPEAE